jgi:hypothetical protein
VGEWFKFRIHYGIVNAGYATLEVKKDATLNNKKNFSCKKGSPRNVSFFFKVDDLYESYIDKETEIRISLFEKLTKVDIQNQEGFFNQSINKVVVKDTK